MSKVNFDYDHEVNILANILRFKLSDLLVGDYLFQQVVINKEYFPEEISVSNLKNVVDIGANVGLFSCLVSALYPDSTIYAFEPAESNFERLKYHLQINEITRVNAYKFGLGEKNEYRPLFMPHDEGAYSLFESNAKLYTRGQGYNKKSTVVEIRAALETLESCGIENIDFMKIDCEGAELEILKSIEPVLSRTRFIAIEWHPNVDVIELETILTRCNFTFFRKFERFKNGDPKLNMGTLFGIQGSAH